MKVKYLFRGCLVDCLTCDHDEEVGLLCKSCGEYKLFRYFDEDITRPHGYRLSCKKCQGTIPKTVLGPEMEQNLQEQWELKSRLLELQQQETEWTMRELVCKSCSGKGYLFPVQMKAGAKLVGCKDCKNTGKKPPTEKPFDGEKQKINL